MPSIGHQRFEEVQVERTPGLWSTLTPAEFQKIPLADRIQLILSQKIRFLSSGKEISPLQALKD